MMMTPEVIYLVAPKPFLIVFGLLTGCLVTAHGLEYDKTFNVQPQPIQFLEEPTDHVTLAGVEITFVCSTTVLMFDGFSIPPTTWFHNNTIINSDRHYIISDNGSYSTLTVKNVTHDDQGVYHCIVSDWKIKIRSRHGHLNVVESKGLTAFINGTLHSTITLPCSVQSSTKPTWFKSNEKITFSKYKTNQLLLLEDGSLQLFSVNEDSSGLYHCLVNESNVTRNESFHITVQKSNKKNTRPVIQSKSSSQYLLIIPDNCDNSPHDQTVTLQCPVTGYPSPVICWYLNGELVNLTDYNITDSVENNTWIIQGGDPCGLIGYWQCFATNEAGTVHNEIRVLPYGWSTLPRTPALKATEVVQEDNRQALASYMISWQPPLYLGGINLTDVNYMVTIKINKKEIGPNIVNNTYFRIPHIIHVKPGLLKTLHTEVHVAFTQVNSAYLPTDMSTIATYDREDLIETAIGFLPPIFNVSCFENGSALLDWSLHSSGNLSLDYLNLFVKNWVFTGRCKSQQGDVFESTEYSGGVIGTPGAPTGNIMFYDLSNGTICNYEVYYLYMDTQSLSSSAYCTVSIDNDQPPIENMTTASIIIPHMSVDSSGITNTVERSTYIISSKVLPTTLHNQSPTNSVLSTSPDAFNVNVTRTLHTSSMQKNLSTMSVLNATDATHSTANSAIIASTPLVYSSHIEKGLSPGLLGTVLGLFFLFLIILAVMCSAAVVIYQRKNSRHIKDYKFLKVSQFFKYIKSPVSNNYCSTIDIAGESVCESVYKGPVNKVMKWIDNSDFQNSAKMLQQSNSVDSLTQSEMIAYICKQGKNGNHKWLSGDCDEDWKHQTEKLANNSCSQLSTSDSAASHYLREEHHKTKTLSSFIGTACDQSSSKTFSLSDDSSCLRLQTMNCTNRKPTDLFFTSDKCTNMPLFTPKVTNPIFADTSSSTLADPLTSSSLLHSPIETDLLNDKLQMLPHTTDNDVSSQLSDSSGVPSHYLHEADCCNKKITFSSSDSDDDPANSHDDTTNDNILQCSDEVFLPQSTRDVNCNVMASSDSRHLNNKKPANLSIPKKSVGMPLFTPKVTNPIFAGNSDNSSSIDSNSLNSESSLLPQSYNEKDALQFMLLHSQLHEMDDVFSQASNDSDVPSHYLHEGNFCFGETGTSSASSNKFTHSPSDKTNKNSCKIEENFSPQDSNNLCANTEFHLFTTRKSVSLPVITPKHLNPKFSGVAPTCVSTSLLQSSTESDLSSAELDTMYCKRMECDEALSHLSISSVAPSHYMHERDVSDERTSSHYFDDIAGGQIGHNIVTNSSQATKNYQTALPDLCLNETSDTNMVYSLNSLFVGSHELSATNPLTTPGQGETYRMSMKEFDLDSISQFSYSDTNSELNPCTDTDCDDFNFGYTQ